MTGRWKFDEKITDKRDEEKRIASGELLGENEMNWKYAVQ